MTDFPVVRVTKAFDVHAGRAIIAYPEGFEGKVPRNHLEVGQAVGAVEIVNGPKQNRVGPKADAEAASAGVDAGERP
jgi:hypothetical protein